VHVAGTIRAERGDSRSGVQAEKLVLCMMSVVSDLELG
jgi:hypothetical protein